MCDNPPITIRPPHLNLVGAPAILNFNFENNSLFFKYQTIGHDDTIPLESLFLTLAKMPNAAMAIDLGIRIHALTPPILERHVVKVIVNVE